MDLKEEMKARETEVTKLQVTMKYLKDTPFGMREGKRDASRGRSKSRGKKDIQCHFCDKFGHLKKDCYAWKREKGKGKDKGNSSASEDKPKSSVKIDELNVVTHTSDS